MLRTLQVPNFLQAKRSPKSVDAIKNHHVLDGPIVPTLGYATRGGDKHTESEDRVFTSTLAEVIGCAGEDMSFSDMLEIQPGEVLPEEVLIAGVFDGHGGASCVEFVAENLCDRIGKAFEPCETKTFAQLENAFCDGFKACDDDFMRLAHQEEGNNSGCCALISFIYQNQILIGWVGDCRAVFYDGSRAQQLTVDHRISDPAEVKRIHDSGGKVINNRLNGVLTPTRCFGDRDVRISSPEGVLIAEPGVLSVAPLSESMLKNRSAFLILATDGVWDVLSNEAACDIVSKTLKMTGYDAEEAALRLIEEAARYSSDDVSVCVITWNVIPWDVYSGIVCETFQSDEGEKH